MKEQFKIGVFAGAHGVKGDVKVFPLTDDIRRYEQLKEITVHHNGKIMQYRVDKVWYHKKFVMLKLAEIQDMNAAQALKGGEIVIGREQAIPLAEDEYYVPDLLGLEVRVLDGKKLGHITDVLPTGANDVYEISKKHYIPAIKSCILEVNLSEGFMLVELPEGLIDP